ncbi:MAG: hypothetical protein U5R14_04920 [Gemmatimonadota bacterium]|nr:hypothetical protein [Gemmatimonadota bacterium]
MRDPSGFIRLLTVALALVAFPADGLAQVREVVAKQVSVGADEATLELDFTGGDPLEVAFRDGTITVDGAELGMFEPGGELDAAWRALLGQAVALENGPLVDMMLDWSPPSALTGEAAEVADALDRTLEEALRSPAASTPGGDGVSISIQNGPESALRRLLLGSMARLSVIEEALAGLGPEVSVYIEEDLDVPTGEIVEGSAVVIGGSARVAGEIRGDLVVVDGSVALDEGSVVTGELRLANTRVLHNVGVVEGGVVDVLEDERSETVELREQIRSEVRDEIRRDLRDEIRLATRGTDDGFSFFAPFQSVVRGIGGVIEKVFIVLVLGLLGAGAVAFAGDNLELVAETARRAPGRATAVGLAGTFLLIPVWILGAVALVVSIVGIPVALVWLPLFPAAVVVAGLFGYLAVAKNAGEWLADSGYAWTDWVRVSNPVHTIIAGLIGLVLAFVIADMVSILPFFGFLSGLLVFVGGVLTFFAIQVGFGAVILTRGGRRREYRAMDPDEAWASAMGMDPDEDDARRSSDV